MNDPKDPIEKTACQQLDKLNQMHMHPSGSIMGSMGQLIGQGNQNQTSYAPQGKQHIYTVIARHQRAIKRYEILLAMLPTTMTPEQDEALHLILNKI